MNSFRLIVERLDYERLINEGRDPVEVLRYKYRDVPDNVVNKVISIDPTKKKSYSQWLLSHWPEEHDVIVSGLKDGSIDKLFKHYRGHNDIQIKDCPSVSDGLRMFAANDDSVLAKSSKPKTYVENLGIEVDSDLANDFDVVFNEDNWLIAIPNTYEAECKLGENCRWCTANAFGSGRSYYDRYTQNGDKLYVNFDKRSGETLGGKDYPYTRYQFHFGTKQFADSDDATISPNETNIPDSAVKFYESLGFDAEAFESDEIKMYRYEEQRGGCAYFINDELSLNIEYDEDYEFTNPDETTSYYLYDYNDDRDPLSWETIKNPNFNKVVKYKGENVVVIEQADELFIIAINDGSNHYRDWSAYDNFTDYLLLPNGGGAVAVTVNGEFEYLSEYGKIANDRLKVADEHKMFINEPCSTACGEGNVFVEIDCGRFHSLFRINGETLDCIILRDIPENKQFFTVDSNGAIQGCYGKYRLTHDSQGEDYFEYDIHDVLPDGDRVISTVLDGAECYNIIKNGDNKPLFNMWFDKFIDKVGSLYIMGKDSNAGYFDESAKQVGEWYGSIGILDRENGVVGGRPKDGYTYLINAFACHVFATFEKVLTPRPSDHKIIVKTTDGQFKGYDYVERKFCYPRFESIKPLTEFNHDVFMCTMPDGVGLLDFPNQKMITIGNGSIKRIGGSYSDYYVLNRQNGMVNLFNIKEKSEVLPFDVDSIFDVSESLIGYTVKGRNYIALTRYGKIIGNPNGFTTPVWFDDYYVCGTKGDCDIVLYKNPYNDNGELTIVSWTDKKTHQKSRWLNQDTPQEVYDMYYDITGRSNVTESFVNLMSRMDRLWKN